MGIGAAATMRTQVSIHSTTPVSGSDPGAVTSARSRYCSPNPLRSSASPMAVNAQPMGLPRTREMMSAPAVPYPTATRVSAT